MRRLLILSFLSASSFAQTGSVGFPALGFAPDSRSSQIRPIRGVPGAAILGDPLDLATSAFSIAAISPQQDLALAVAGDRQLYVVPFSEAMRPIPEAMPAPSHIAFSPSGRAAVIWGSRIQVLTDLAASARAIDVALVPFSVPSTIALSDDAHQLLISSGQDADQLQLLSPEGGSMQLPLPGSVTAIAFRRDTHDAVAVTRSGDVYLVRNAGPDAEIRQIYLGDPQTSDPVAVQISPDGTQAFTANARGMLSAIDLRTGAAAAVSCHCSPSGLDPLNATAIYRLTEISDQPVMLFDASNPIPRIWFIPVDAASAGSAGRQRSAQ